jgi:hypothetical protein
MDITTAAVPELADAIYAAGSVLSKSDRALIRSDGQIAGIRVPDNVSELIRFFNDLIRKAMQKAARRHDYPYAQSTEIWNGRAGLKEKGESPRSRFPFLMWLGDKGRGKMRIHEILQMKDGLQVCQDGIPVIDFGIRKSDGYRLKYETSDEAMIWLSQTIGMSGGLGSAQVNRYDYSLTRTGRPGKVKEPAAHLLMRFVRAAVCPNMGMQIKPGGSKKISKQAFYVVPRATSFGAFSAALEALWHAHSNISTAMLAQERAKQEKIEVASKRKADSDKRKYLYANPFVLIGLAYVYMAEEFGKQIFDAADADFIEQLAGDKLQEDLADFHGFDIYVVCDAPNTITGNVFYNVGSSDPLYFLIAMYQLDRRPRENEDRQLGLLQALKQFLLQASGHIFEWESAVKLASGLANNELLGVCYAEHICRKIVTAKRPVFVSGGLTRFLRKYCDAHLAQEGVAMAELETTSYLLKKAGSFGRVIGEIIAAEIRQKESDASEAQLRAQRVIVRLNGSRAPATPMGFQERLSNMHQKCQIGNLAGVRPEHVSAATYAYSVLAAKSFRLPLTHLRELWAQVNLAAFRAISMTFLAKKGVRS